MTATAEDVPLAGGNLELVPVNVEEPGRAEYAIGAIGPDGYDDFVGQSAAFLSGQRYRDTMIAPQRGRMEGDGCLPLSAAKGR